MLPINSSLFSVNTTDPRRLPVPVLSITTFTLGVIGNILVVFFLLYKRNEHRWPAVYKYVLALTLTNLIGNISTTPVVFAYFDGLLTLLDNPSLCNYVGVMLLFSSYSTFFLMSAMTLDECILVVFEQVHRKKEKYVIPGCWAIALLFSCLPIFGLGEIVVHFPRSWCLFNYAGRETKDSSMTFLFVAIGFISFGLCIFGSIFPMIKCFTEKRSRQNVSMVRTNFESLMKMILVVVFSIVFVVCWAPFLVRLIINQTRRSVDNPITDVIALAIASFNQVLFPFVFLLLCHETTLKICGCFRQDGGNNETELA